jgi:hypothetical protein
MSLRARLLLVLGLCAGGCDISARPFAGSILQMSIAISGPAASPGGTHLELWARSQFDDVLRINPINDFNCALYPMKCDPKFPDGRPGVMVVKAITMSDPCMIDAHGNLLTTGAAYPGPVSLNGVTQSPDQQAAQVRNRIAQVTSTTECDSDGHCGLQTVQLFAVVPWEETPAPTFATPPSALERLQACQAYWNESPLTYTPNPAQITAPLHGQVYGFISFNTLAPPAGYDGIRIDTPVHLKGLRELFVTTETTNVDPANRGPLFLQGVPDIGGRETTHFDLTGPTAAGTAAIIVDIDDDPVQF